MTTAIPARKRLIDQRAAELVDRALTADVGWIKVLGPRPTDPGERQRWDAQAHTFAAYRDRYGVTDGCDPLGPTVEDDRQRTTAREVAAAAIGPDVAAGRSDAALVAAATAPAPGLQRQAPVER